MEKNVIYSINGCVVKVKNATSFSMMEKVYVGNHQLMGEVISINSDETLIQVYESTSGLRVGEPVTGSHDLISVELGVGLLNNIYDGILRPLKVIADGAGAMIPVGSNVESLDRKKLWDVYIDVKIGDDLKYGMIYAHVQETQMIEHRLLVPKGIEGKVISCVQNGKYTIDDTIVVIEDQEGIKHKLTLTQKWPIKTPRDVAKRLPLSEPLISGQRIFDTLFPIAKGGTAAIPGGFGTGKTMTQHQLAKWCDADIIVYVGCGERGNEMTQVLEEFSELVDPRTKRPLMERTILIANTSNMPVAAREASIYTGLTLAEYYRDMGYHVAIMADSTSRWAEALREISGRLEEMPAEEGFPAYLPSRIAQFYERAGYMETLCGKIGSVSIIGAVSPQGNDFSEPVTQNTKRFVRCFWALDKSLAYARHYFAVNWNDSYSEYIGELTPYYQQNIDHNFMQNRNIIMQLLSQENKLMEIVKLIGSDVLPEDQKLIIEIGRVIRLGFLQQNAFHPQDTYVPLVKQYKMMDVIIYLYKSCQKKLTSQIPLSLIIKEGIFDQVIQMKYTIKNDQLQRFDQYYQDIDACMNKIR